MDDNTSTVKQQLVETLRGAQSVVITTGKNPGSDEIAAAIGLHLLLEKLEKVAEVVIVDPVPERLSFLPTHMVKAKLQGQRDFVIELDQSRVEADSLKYITEDNKLKIYITPYNGSFTKDDASFSYGDYHCDGIIGLGAKSLDDIDEHIRNEEKLTQNAPFLLLNSEQDVAPDGASLNWADSGASSVCEMIMSMSEALGSGMLDEDIATALLTGIIDKTSHFTNQVTTPKVMTMSAQLLAAGARQSEIINQLSRPQQPRPADPKQDDSESKNGQDGPRPDQEEKKQTAPNEFQIRKQEPQSEPKGSDKPDDKEPQSVNLRQPDDQSDQQDKLAESQSKSKPAETQHRPQSGVGYDQSATVGGSQLGQTPSQQSAPQQNQQTGPSGEGSPPPQAPQQPAAASSPPQQQNTPQGSSKKMVEPPGGYTEPKPVDRDALFAALNEEEGKAAPQQQAPSQSPPPQQPPPQQPPSQPQQAPPQTNQPQPPPGQPQPAQQTPSPDSPQQPQNQQDISSARRAVEQALQDSDNPSGDNQKQ